MEHGSQRPAALREKADLNLVIGHAVTLVQVLGALPAQGRGKALGGRPRQGRQGRSHPGRGAVAVHHGVLPGDPDYLPLLRAGI